MSSNMANVRRSHSMPTLDVAYERGLPANLDAERFVLGSILLDSENYITVAGLLDDADFSLEANRRIYARMRDLYDRGERIDRVTLADELMRQNQLHQWYNTFHCNA